MCRTAGRRMQQQTVPAPPEAARAAAAAFFLFHLPLKGEGRIARGDPGRGHIPFDRSPPGPLHLPTFPFQGEVKELFRL